MAEKARKNRIKDSFILLGDPTFYDKYIFGVENRQPAKFIHNEDYIVVKRNPDGSPYNEADIDNTKVSVSDDFIEDVIAEMISKGTKVN